MKTLLKEREVRNIRRFLTQSIGKINVMLKKSTLSSQEKSNFVKQKEDMIKSRENLISLFESKKAELYASQWKKTILELGDEKVVSSLMVGQGTPILSIAELSERNSPKKRGKKQ